MDQLAYIKKALGKHDSHGLEAIAGSAEVSTRTLYKVMEDGSNPRYKTVKAIMEALKAVKVQS